MALALGIKHWDLLIIGGVSPNYSPNPGLEYIMAALTHGVQSKKMPKR
jgi:hypothetical protein